MFERSILSMFWILKLPCTVICYCPVCCSHLNTAIAGQRKYNHKTLCKKCQTLEDLEGCQRFRKGNE